MTRLQPARFEVERFQLAGNARLEVRGRWFGVRGRRFMRPALTAVADGREQRILAVLDHKPWNPEEGETWLAAFPCSTDPAGLVQAELTVAPDVTVPLPPASAPAINRRPRRRASRPSPPRHEHTKVNEAGPDLGLVEDRDDPDSRLRPQHDAALRSRDEAISELQAAKRECERLRGERRQALNARDAAIAERRERIEAEVRLRSEDLRAEAERERGWARQAAQSARERDEACAARDEARRAGNRTIAERDNARTRVKEVTRQWELTAALGTRRTLERDALAVERDDIARERDTAVEERDRIAHERDTALEERDRIAHERDTALAPREPDTDEPTHVPTERELLKSEATPVVAERAPLMPWVQQPGRGRRAVATSSVATSPGARSARPHDAAGIWRARLLAASALLVAVVILAVLLLAK